MRICLVRHGQSLWQLAPSRDLDTRLSDLGHRQAAALATWWAEHELLDATTRLDVGVLSASPLKRAQETAGHLADALHLPVTTSPALTEATFHVASELPQWSGPAVPRTPGTLSERYRTFRKQAAEALLELADTAREKDATVLAVTHGGFIKTVMRVISDSDSFTCKLYNCGINMIEWKDGRWRIVHLNLLDHLPPPLRTS